MDNFGHFWDKFGFWIILNFANLEKLDFTNVMRFLDFFDIFVRFWTFFGPFLATFGRFWTLKNLWNFFGQFWIPILILSKYKEFLTDF